MRGGDGTGTIRNQVAGSGDGGVELCGKKLGARGLGSSSGGSETAVRSWSGDVVLLRGDGGDLVAGHSGCQAIVGGQGRRERVRPKGQEFCLWRGYDAKYESAETRGTLPVEGAEMGREKLCGGFSPSAPRYGHVHAGLRWPSRALWHSSGVL